MLSHGPKWRPGSRPCSRRRPRDDRLIHCEASPTRLQARVGTGLDDQRCRRRIDPAFDLNMHGPVADHLAQGPHLGGLVDEFLPAKAWVDRHHADEVGQVQQTRHRLLNHPEGQGILVLINNFLPMLKQARNCGATDKRGEEEALNFYGLRKIFRNLTPKDQWELS